MGKVRIPARRKADPSKREIEPDYIDIFDHEIPKDQHWYWSEKEGGRKLFYGFAGAIRGTKIRCLTALQLELLFFYYGDKNRPLGNAVYSYYEALCDYISSEHRWEDVYVPFGSTYRGKTMRQVLDKGWMRWVMDDNRSKICRERYPLFFKALQRWLDNPRITEVTRDIGQSTAVDDDYDNEESQQDYEHPTADEVSKNTENGYDLDVDNHFVVSDNAPVEYATDNESDLDYASDDESTTESDSSSTPPEKMKRLRRGSRHAQSKPELNGDIPDAALPDEEKTQSLTEAKPGADTLGLFGDNIPEDEGPSSVSESSRRQSRRIRRRHDTHSASSEPRSDGETISSPSTLATPRTPTRNRSCKTIVSDDEDSDTQKGLQPTPHRASSPSSSSNASSSERPKSTRDDRRSKPAPHHTLATPPPSPTISSSSKRKRRGSQDDHESVMAAEDITPSKRSCRPLSTRTPKRHKSNNVSKLARKFISM